LCCLSFGVAASSPAPAGAETLNKVVASVGYDAITQRDVLEEYNFERFLEGKFPAGAPSGVEGQSVLNRLIRQTLLDEQMRSPDRDSENARKAAAETLNAVQEKFPNKEAYRSALQSLGMTEQQALERLELYQRTLRMVNNRLRPAALPDPSDVEDYYKKTFVPEYAKGHTGSPPPLDDVRQQIQEILVQKKMNQMLEDWLERLKSTHQVNIYSY
jgi:peptidyl-prolyl cis-trans isomerase SurA